MQTRSLTLAAPVLLALTGAAMAQTPPSSGASRDGTARRTFMAFSLADMTGPIYIDPDTVSAVQTSPEQPKKWSIIRFRDGQATVEGAVDDVVSRLGRTP